MIRIPTRSRSRRRRGAILLVVITLLALFAVIGLSFALYADAEASAARMAREAQNNPRDTSDVEAVLNPGDAFNKALGQLVFGSSDADPQGVQSGFRGYEFARLMYGQPRQQNTLNPMPMLSPYTGAGLFTATDGLPPMNLPGIGAFDRTQVINYGYQPGPAGAMFIIDPEYSSYRNNIASPTAFDGTPQVYKNIAAPYTYPDLKDLNLAVIDPTTGKVLQPSFFRNYTFNTGTATADARLAPPNIVPTNTDWLTPAGRLRIIRPRPADHTFDPDGLGPAPATTEFPYPPPNADGSYTGDVLNFPGAQNNQRNDSVWVYPGGAVKMYKGKRYTALIAPMVIDLNSRVNLGMAGNRKGGGGATHASSQGASRSEVNPRWVFDPNATTQAMLTPGSQTALNQLLSGNTFTATSGSANVAGRYGPAVGTTIPPADRLTGLNQIQFNAGRVPPQYSGIDADAVGVGITDRAVPAGSGTSPFPVFPNTRYYDVTTQAAELGNHPAQYNPEYYNRSSAPPTGGFGPFLPIDERVLGTKYAGLPEPYSRTDAGRLAPQQLISSNLVTPPFDPYNTPTTTTDQANLTRALVTTFSTSLNRAERVVRSGPPVSPGVYPTARLGPVDVNRPMPDYRDLTNPNNQPTPKMLGPDNMGNWPTAQAARQSLARDIFIRLASLYTSPNPPTPPATQPPPLIDGDTIYYVAGSPNVATPSYQDPNIDHGYLRIQATATPESIALLRILAQIAVNMVDYLDPDDVATTFTWRPVHPTFGYILQPVGTAPNLIPNVYPGVSAAGSNSTPTGPGTIPPAELGNHIVYGTEAPRVVLNEVYAELTNNKADYDPAKGIPKAMIASQSFEKRFWVELFNPMRQDAALSESGMARLHYPAGVFGVGSGAPGLPPGPYSPYAVVVTNYVAGGIGINDPANVTGSPKHASAAGAATPIVEQAIVDKYDYSPGADFPVDPSLADPAQGGVILDGPTYQPFVPTTPNANLQQYVIQPHAGTGAGQNASNKNGFYVMGPEPNFPGQDATNAGNPAASLRTQASTATTPVNSTLDPTKPGTLEYQIGSQDEASVQTTDALKPVSVYLRRLANPYLPPNDPLETATFVPTAPINPYITVDRQENVQVNNNLWVGKTMQINPAPTPASQKSLGRLHPFAANLSYAQTTVVANSPSSTFFNHDDNTGLTTAPQTPLKWLVHLDRQLVSPIELAHVSAVGPTQLTQDFGVLGAGPTPTYNRHTIETLLLPGVYGGVSTTPPPPFPPPPTPPPPGYLSQLGFFDMLQSRGPQSAIPVGGREHGKININTVWHPSVLRALLDRNDANLFNDTDVSGAPTAAWERMTTVGTGLRSAAFPDVLTTDVTVPQHDSPFRGMADLIQRGFSQGPPQTQPLFYNQNPAAITGLTPEQLAAVQDQTVVIDEPLRKIFNNTTTTSDAFLVIMTVGFFEVRNDPTLTNGRVYLGKELYDQVPGDRRYKFFAIVDRTQLALDHTSPPASYYQQAPTALWQTTLTKDINPGDTTIELVAQTNNPIDDPAVLSNASVFADGNTYYLVPSTGGGVLRLGFGDGSTPAAPAGVNNGGDGEWLTTLPLPPATPTPIPQTVRPVQPGVNGVVRISLAAPATRYHPAGSPIGNYILGNPGPQPNFDPNVTKYKSVVPYFSRVSGNQ